MFEVKESLFWFCAAAGSGLFLVQFLLSFLGAEDEDGGGNFKWLSKQALSGFLMMFGWVGLTCRKEFGTGNGVAIALGVMGGAFAMFVSAFLFKVARKLRSTGTVFQIEKAIGKEAVVYQRIPQDGVGKVTVSIEGIGHELDAISLDGKTLDSFSAVKIVKIENGQTAVVAPK